MPYDLEKQLSVDSSPGNQQPPVGLYDHDVRTTKTASHTDDDYSSMHKVGRIVTSDDGNYVWLGRTKFNKYELLEAFGGTLNPGLAAPSKHKFGNPAPLGLSAFALTTFVLSLVNAGAMGVSHDNIVVGLAIFYGGLVQLLAGMWELAVENTFGGLSLGSYGGFWMSFGAISIPFFGISDAYKNNPIEFENALGFYLIGWAIFTAMLCLVTIKSTVGFFSLFFFLTLTFLMLGIGKLGHSDNCTTAGGVLGIITAFIAWYNAFAGVANEQNSYITVHALPIPKFGRQANEKETKHYQ